MKNIYSIKLFYLKLKHLLLVLISGFRFKYNNIITNECLENINKIKKNGFCIIESYLTDKQCKMIINDINLHIDNSQSKIYIDKEKSDYRIFGANDLKNEFIQSFFKDLKILMIVENYMKLKVENAYTMAAKLLFKKKNLGSGGGWHRDSINLSMKAMVYLVDTTENNGPLQILQDSNGFKNQLEHHMLIKKIDFKDTRFTNDEVTKIVEVKKNKINTIKSKAGTLIIFDGSYIHRGSPVREGVRYAITNYYAPKLRVKREKEAVKSFLINSN